VGSFPAGHASKNTGVLDLAGNGLGMDSVRIRGLLTAAKTEKEKRVCVGGSVGRRHAPRTERTTNRLSVWIRSSRAPNLLGFRCANVETRYATPKARFRTLEEEGKWEKCRDNEPCDGQWCALPSLYLPAACDCGHRGAQPYVTDDLNLVEFPPLESIWRPQQFGHPRNLATERTARRG